MLAGLLEEGLEILDLSDNFLTIPSCKALGQALEKPGCQLKELRLGRNRTDKDSATATFIKQRTGCAGLSEVFNPVQLILESLSINKSLTALELPTGSITPDCIQARTDF